MSITDLVYRVQRAIVRRWPSANVVCIRCGWRRDLRLRPHRRLALLTRSATPRGSPFVKRAALYLRVSGAPGQTVDNQLPELEALVSRRGMTIIQVYEEIQSAAKARPVFKEMLEDAMRGQFDVVCVWALDRFGRSMAGNIRDVLALERAGIELVSVREPWLDTGGPVRDLLLAIFSWIAEQERARIVERTNAGLARVRAHGSKSGKPIGRPRRLDRETVDEVIRLHWLGRSSRQIAMALKLPRRTVRRALVGQNGEAEPPPFPPRRSPP
jgi:putative DNA-invertase from lambdoid prophage Rac